MTDRTVVVRRDGVALVEPLPADDVLIATFGDGLFDPDPDPRPMPVRSPVGRYTVLELAADAVLGDVSWVPVVHGPTVGCLAWNIGVTLLPAARGHGVGTLAQRLLVEHLFATTDLDRIEASTDVANVAEQRALLKAGLRREGVIRGAQLRGGERRDIVLYGVLRTDR